MCILSIVYPLFTFAMKILILEWIATSWKTTVLKNLTESWNRQGLKYKIVDESVTLMPLIDNADKSVSIRFLLDLLHGYCKGEGQPDFLIFDRLYFTHIFRTQSSIQEFKEIEGLLSQYETLLVLLMIDKEQIPQRIISALAHRDEKRGNFVRKKGSDEEIIAYYTNQQQALLELIQQSHLPHTIQNTTDWDFERVENTIQTTLFDYL